VGTINGWLGQHAQNRDLAELWYRGIQDYESLEGADRLRFGAFAVQLFHVFEEMYYQQREGHLEQRLWREVETPMRELINTWPGIRTWWRSYSHWFSEEFAKFVNQLQQTAKPSTFYREPNPDQ
jgi:hypothetical protein